MFRTISLTAALAAGILLAGCGTSSEGPGGSKAQTASGVNEIVRNMQVYDRKLLL